MPAPKSSIQPEPLHFEHVAPDRIRTGAVAENTRGVEFHGRFGKRKITGTETRLHAGAKKLLHEIFDGAGEIAEGNIGIDGQAFYLMEHERMRGVGIVAAIHLARHDYAHWRLGFFHGANLYWRGVRTQKQT